MFSWSAAPLFVASTVLLSSAPGENMEPTSEKGIPLPWLPAFEVPSFFPFFFSLSPSPLNPPARRNLSHPFFGWEGSPTKIDYRKKEKIGHPYSKLSTGGPSPSPVQWQPFFVAYLLGCGHIESTKQVSPIRVPVPNLWLQLGAFWIHSVVLRIAAYFGSSWS